MGNFLNKKIVDASLLSLVATDIGTLHDALKSRVDNIEANLGVGQDLSGSLTSRVGALETKMPTKADLVDGKIPTSLLPSYVDDVVEGFYKESDGKFYLTRTSVDKPDSDPTVTYNLELSENATTDALKLESSKIYVDKRTNKVYRWSGSTFVNISNPISLDTVTPANNTQVTALSDDKAFSEKVSYGLYLNAIEMISGIASAVGEMYVATSNDLNITWLGYPKAN